MIVVCWSPKGGSGTSVVAAGAALVAARRGAVVLADLGGDQASLLGLTPPTEPGLADWLAAQPGAPPDALARLTVPVAPGFDLLAYGRIDADPPADPWADPPADAQQAGAALADALCALGRDVVVDAGWASPHLVAGLAERATAVMMVVRPCYLGLRRAVHHPLRALSTRVVLVDEPGRAITAADVRGVTGIDVVCRVRLRASTARAIDAGLFPERVPDDLARAVQLSEPSQGGSPPAPDHGRAA